MTDKFLKKVLESSDYGYTTISYENHPDAENLLSWARQMRSEGHHLAIFFRDNTLIVHYPKELEYG